MTKLFDRTTRALIFDVSKTISDKYLSQLLTDIFGRYEYHLEIAQKNHNFFRNTHYLLSFLIPIYSAFFTYIVSNNLIKSSSILGVVGLFLTIATIIVSVLKPYERCVSASNILIVLNNWKTDLVIELGHLELELNEAQKNQELYKLLERKDQELSKIGGTMRDTLIPTSNMSVQENADNKKN